MAVFPGMTGIVSLSQCRKKLGTPFVEPLIQRFQPATPDKKRPCSCVGCSSQKILKPYIKPQNPLRLCRKFRFLECIFICDTNSISAAKRLYLCFYIFSGNQSFLSDIYRLLAVCKI